MNEKMRVLDMLEAGKITAEEASILLEALASPHAEVKHDIEEKIHTFANDVTKFAKDAGCKMQVYYKSVEPKLKKASQTALEKAAAALDTLANNISESIERAEKCDDPNCECNKEDTPVEN